MRLSEYDVRPYIGYQVRHPHDKRVVLFSFVSLAAFLFGYRYSRVSDKKRVTTRFPQGHCQQSMDAAL